MAEYCEVEHPFEPIYDDKSKILILGSIPSVVSRQQGFYYMHPRNAFWRILSALCQRQSVPETIEEKTHMLLEHHIAIWDVMKSCSIKGSDDSSITNAVAADIPALLKKSQITHVFANGKKAAEQYNRQVLGKTGIEIFILPSTSPANAGMNFEAKLKEWSVILQYI